MGWEEKTPAHIGPRPINRFPVQVDGLRTSEVALLAVGVRMYVEPFPWAIPLELRGKLSWFFLQDPFVEIISDPIAAPRVASSAKHGRKSLFYMAIFRDIGAAINTGTVSPGRMVRSSSIATILNDLSALRAAKTA